MLQASLFEAGSVIRIRFRVNGQAALTHFELTCYAFEGHNERQGE